MLLNYIGHLVLSSACNTSTIQNQPHQISNTQRTENKTTDVVIQKHSRKLLMMDILMSKTCWAHKKWNKTASDIKLVFHSSTTITIFWREDRPGTMHGFLQFIPHNPSAVHTKLSQWPVSEFSIRLYQQPITEITMTDVCLLHFRLVLDFCYTNCTTLLLKCGGERLKS